MVQRTPITNQSTQVKSNRMFPIINIWTKILGIRTDFCVLINYHSQAIEMQSHFPLLSGVCVLDWLTTFRKYQNCWSSELPNNQTAAVISKIGNGIKILEFFLTCVDKCWTVVSTHTFSQPMALTEHSIPLHSYR